MFKQFFLFSLFKKKQHVFTRRSRGEAEHLRPDRLQEARVEAARRQEAVREGVHAVRVQPDDPAANAAAGRPAVSLVQDQVPRHQVVCHGEGC